MTNEDFYTKVLDTIDEVMPGTSLYEFQKKCEGTVQSTFLTMFRKKSCPRLEYIASISKALGKSQGELLEPESSKDNLTPLQIEIVNRTDGLDEKIIREIITAIEAIKVVHGIK